MSSARIVIYILGKDLRVSDNPVFHRLATTSDHGFTHLLPVFNFPSNQIEISGFLKNGQSSPFPPAVSHLGRYWRCGRHRAAFLAQSVWDLKQSLEKLGSGLCLRVGKTSEVIKDMIEHFKDKGPSVAAVWMTEEHSHEEVQEQNAIAQVCSDNKVDFKLWHDEKYFIDDRDTKLEDPADLPDVFTNYRKTQEPLREKPRAVLPRPTKSSLPSFPNNSIMPSQQHPYVMAENLDDLKYRLLSPLFEMLDNPPPMPKEAASAHTFCGGESAAQDRLHHLIISGSITNYKDTRNGLLGLDYSTKLGAYLSLGCLTARQVHEEMLKLEDGSDAQYSQAKGYGKGENNGSAAVRFELLWRDYMHLSTKKFGVKLFQVKGFRQGQQNNGNPKSWLIADKTMAPSGQNPSPGQVADILQRFLEGTTGMGLIDASQRELFHTGYTSNRARQNVASFLSKHLGIDWRYGAEWYESMLIDYDVSSNWANWQYLAGVGNDPRSDDRIFNPVKQAFDYDKDGAYVRTWMPEIQGLKKLQNLFQPCTASIDDLAEAGITQEHVMFTQPLKKISFEVNYKAKTHRGGNRNRQGWSSRRGDPGRGGTRTGNGNTGSHCNGGQSTCQVQNGHNDTYAPQGDHFDNTASYNGCPGGTSCQECSGNGHSNRSNGSGPFSPSFVSNINVHMDPTAGHFPYSGVPGMANGGGFGYPNFHPQGYQPQTYQPQGFQTQAAYQPQAYQVQAFQPQGYQPQTYQLQGYQPQANHLNGFTQGSFPPFGYPGANHQAYHTQPYQTLNHQGTPSQGHQGSNPQAYHGYPGGHQITGVWRGYERQGGQRGLGTGGRGRGEWGQTNSGDPVCGGNDRATHSTPSPQPDLQSLSNQTNPEPLISPQQQLSTPVSENGEMPMRSTRSTPFIPRFTLELTDEPEDPENSNTIEHESASQPPERPDSSME